MRVPEVSLLISSTVCLWPTSEDWERGQDSGEKSVQCVPPLRVGTRGINAPLHGLRPSKESRTPGESANRVQNPV